jgi:hypothetical protein
MVTIVGGVVTTGGMVTIVGGPEMVGKGGTVIMVGGVDTGGMVTIVGGVVMTKGANVGTEVSIDMDIDMCCHGSSGQS